MTRFVGLLLLGLLSCVEVPALPTPVATRCQVVATRSGAELATLFDKVQRPLVLVGDEVLVCDCARHLIAGQTETRQVAGATEQRKVAGATEQRQVAGAAEERKLAGDSERRHVAGDTEDRQVAGSTESRGFAGQTEHREVMGETEHRALGADTEHRQVAGDTEKRGVVGDTEERRLAGATEVMGCEFVPQCSGFRVRGAHNVAYFDGRGTQPAIDGCIP